MADAKMNSGIGDRLRIARGDASDLDRSIGNAGVDGTLVRTAEEAAGTCSLRGRGRSAQRTQDIAPRLKHYPVTPDGRYFVVRGRLWRTTNPSLPATERQALVTALMKARRERDRAGVDRAKRLLGERGPVWWSDGAPDLNRRMARNTPYADWFARLASPRAPIR